MVPAECWLVARINLLACTGAEAPSFVLRGRGPEGLLFHTYAVRRGLTVKSRTWVRMLDICIPFSCETKGSNSAMN